MTEATEDPAKRLRVAARRLRAVDPQSSGEMRLLADVRHLLDQVADELDARPVFPLPVRPDGTHWYVSTYCLHSDHAACRLTCLCCTAPCQCAGCEHEALCTICGALVEPLGMVLHFRAEHATADNLEP